MRVLTIFLFTLIALAAGVACIGLSADLLNAHQTMLIIEQYLADPQGKIAVGLSGALIVLLWLRFLAGGLDTANFRAIVISSDKESFSTITVAAIEEILRKLMATMEHLKDIRVRVIPCKKCIKVFIHLVLIAGVNLADFLDETQKKTRAKLVAILGENKKIIIKVEIKRVVSSKNDESHKWEPPPVPYREYS